MRLSNAAAAVLLFSLAACREANRKAEAPVTPQSIVAPVVTVSVRDLPSFYEAAGTVRARTSATIASRIMGAVREVRVRSGDSVTAGELLVLIDSRDLDVAVRQAQAAREEALSAKGEVDHAIASARANLDLAQATYRRISGLFQKTSVSNQEYDEAGARLKAAQAAYDMAVAKREQVSAKIQQTSEAVSSAEVMRGYAEIRAPFAGTVVEKPVDPGAMAIPGTALLTVEENGPLRLEVPVDESLLPLIRVGQPVIVTIDSLNRTLDARVSEINPLVDPASRALLVKIDLPAIPSLHSGAYGRAKFSRGVRKAVLAPVAAIAEQGQIQSVMVVEGAVARSRMVTLGQKQGDEVEVLSGLQAGERVVSPRPSGLADGAHVEARR